MKIVVVIGTRPEAIKMAPLIAELANDKYFELVTCVTGQHQEMLDPVLKFFEIKRDYDLRAMPFATSLNTLMAHIAKSFDEVLVKEAPDTVLVHGDTTSAMTAAIVAFNRRIEVGHVEAGLRTFDFDHPWPEEMNRTVIDSISKYLFAPTRTASDNLMKGGRSAGIHITGNTVIDALQIAVNRVSEPKIEQLLSERYPFVKNSNRPIVLVTGHRRENFGAGFSNICSALKSLAVDHGLDIVYPVHLNPNVREPVHQILGGIDQVRLIEPVDYIDFVWLMKSADIILTDSGGIQEEAPSLGKPVFVMREKTERPEAVKAGTVELVGTNPATIVNAVVQLLSDKARYESFSKHHNPYGDGFASKRIVKILKGQSPTSVSHPL